MLSYLASYWPTWLSLQAPNQDGEETEVSTSGCSADNERESHPTPGPEEKPILTDGVNPSITSEQPAPTPETQDRKIPVKCSNFDCEEPGTRLCSGCKSAFYCSGPCQTEHWEIHVWDCKVPIHTGHYLRKACLHDLLPTHQQTRFDYGFERAGSYCSNLLGLYQGLWYINQSLTSKELNRWRKNGLLVSKIKETFESVPAQCRGGYYPWFLQNQWILDESPIPEQEGAQAEVERMSKRAWDKIGKDLSSEMPRWPVEKKECFGHYAMALSRGRPPPSTNLWVHAGYCAASGEFEESQLGIAYCQLFERCTFDEYCVAYKSSAVYNLMEKYKALPSGLPSLLDNLRIVLLSSPIMHQSVWWLKQCIDDGLDEFQPSRSVVVDYGFINCKSVPEREALVNIYRTAFRCRDFDAMKLHEACIQGKIYGYVTQIVPLKKKGEIRTMKRLMRNPYPLPLL
ncbi:hypothetical protein E1B28_009293 [Marasmius oreades]|uniref:MYND-type domain-containing protein n=1 Tax=Marasmius oreades TaxID=181124 RepID=A0A9P7S039_9AGAR|nr:uncharacterized protein E1B28_009293 [Marasmius oreades]KAG7092994.1 hypothetical protein E1B28_009293 [Marasmius oreades]